MKLLTLLLILLTGCATSPLKEKVVEKKKVNWPVLQVQTLQISPGHVKKVAFPFSKKWGKTKLLCDNRELVFNRKDEQAISYISIDYKEEKKIISCDLKITMGDESKRIPVASIIVKPYKYPTRFLNVDKKHVTLSDENIKRWQKEVEMQKVVYSSGKEKPYFYESFQNPLGSKITSVYGSKRVFNNKKDSWHSGTDFRARIGTPIPAANRGKVLYAGELFFNGNTVIVDHGAGIFTMYCHLSKFNVKEGELVPKSAIIAYSGNTGRSTAPHLHWGVKVQGSWIDGTVLVKEDKNIITVKKKSKFLASRVKE